MNRMLAKLEHFSYFPSMNKQFFALALVALNQKKYSEAATLLFYICQIYPNFTHAKLHLAQAQMQFQYWQGAQQQLENLLYQRDPDIICNLGICHWQQQQIKQALRYFKYNLIHFPHHIETRENLASLYLQFHRMTKAIGHYQDILNIQAHRFEIRFNLAACYQKQGHYQKALHEYHQILTQHPQHYPSLYNLGVIYYDIKEINGAEHYWQQCLKLKPKQQDLIFLLKRLRQETFSATEYQDYVKHNFDHYANTYNQHLNQTLNYRLPYHLAQYAKKQFSLNQFPKSLDLGCGTGLCGPWLKLYSSTLSGVDISAAMLSEAKKLKTYDHLAHASIHTFLKASKDKYDCVILVDVLPYIDDFKGIMTELIHHLNPGGHILFTSEMSPQYPNSLQANSRFAYHADYLRKISQLFQFKEINQFEVKAREENQMPVLMGIYHWQKN